MAAVGDARGQLWGGLGLIVCATDNPVPHLPSPRIESWVSPTRLGLAGRALAGLEVERDTDFAALIPPPSAPAPSVAPALGPLSRGTTLWTA